MSEKIYYGNVINLSGLYSKHPIKCYEQSSYDKNKYWDADGYFEIDINKLGLQESNGMILFTSENENDVILWTQGVMSTMKMLKRWSS